MRLGERARAARLSAPPDRFERPRRGRVVPYEEFSDEEISIAISNALESIDGLMRVGTKRSRKSIEILLDNINKLEKLKGESV